MSNEQNQISRRLVEADVIFMCVKFTGAQIPWSHNSRELDRAKRIVEIEMKIAQQTSKQKFVFKIYKCYVWRNHFELVFEKVVNG